MGIAAKNVASVRMVQFVNQTTARAIVYLDGMAIRAILVSGIIIGNVDSGGDTAWLYGFLRMLLVWCFFS